MKQKNVVKRLAARKADYTRTIANLDRKQNPAGYHQPGSNKK